MEIGFEGKKFVARFSDEEGIAVVWLLTTVIFAVASWSSK